MKSRLFFTDACSDIESRIVRTLNSQEEYLTGSTANSPRATGDAIQDILSREFESILGTWCSEYSAKFARRAMADLAFTDIDGFYYRVDVKTHRIDSDFNMPNLTSVERLAKFYEDDSNYFVVLLVSYKVSGNRVIVNEARFAPIEFLKWNCLTIGALGWGQIQIANSNCVNIEPCSRRKWMLEFCDRILAFYPKEIAKINERIKHFQTVRQRWESKPDD